MATAGFSKEPGRAFANDAPLPEFGEVRLVRDVVYNGTCFPKGSTGFVVDIHAGGIGYEVEFSSPAEEVVGLRREDLVPL